MNILWTLPSGPSLAPATMKEDLDFANTLKLYIEIHIIFSVHCPSNHSNNTVRDKQWSASTACTELLVLYNILAVLYQILKLCLRIRN